MTDRLYPLIKIRAGSYLLLSNDQQTLWRIYRYVDGPSYGLQDMARDQTFWAAARYKGRVEEMLRRTDEEMEDLLGDWGNWQEHCSFCRTRAEAVEAALD